MNIENRAKLKDIRVEDLPLVLNWRNQNHIRNVMFSSDSIFMEQHKLWFEKLQSSNTAVSKIFYFDEVPRGVVNINDINHIHSSCEWGFYIGEVTETRGMGTILGYSALNYIFKELHMRKVNAEVLENNSISKNFHKKLGFTHDGTLRKHIYKGDEYIDIDIYSIFIDEWLIHSKKIEQKIKGWSL